MTRQSSTSVRKNAAKPECKYTRRAVPKTAQTIQDDREDILADTMPNLLPVERTVSVQFTPGTKAYAYNTTDPTIEVGDLVIVIAPYGGEGRCFLAPGGYPTIVRVTSIKETAETITKATKWILQKVDLTAAAEAQAKREAIELLDAKIARAAKRAQEQMTLERLRDLSPELSELIDQRNALSS